MLTDEQRAAFLISQTVCAMIEAMGMQAENKQREVLGQPMAYGEEAFQEVVDRHGIGHNPALQTLWGER